MGRGVSVPVRCSRCQVVMPMEGDQYVCPSCGRTASVADCEAVQGRTPSRQEVEALMADILQGNVWDAEVWQAAGRVMDLFGVTDDETTPARTFTDKDK